MPWIEATLGSIMGSTLSSAQESIAEAQKALNTATTYMNRANSEVNSVLDALTITQDKISVAGTAGFYFITLSARQGSWNTRLALASMAPPNFGFSAGFAMIVVDVSLNAVASAVASITKAFRTPFNLPSILTTNDPSAGYVPIVPSVSMSPISFLEENDNVYDIWESKSVGGIFTGALNGLVQDNNLMIKQAKSVVDLTNQVGQRAASIQRGLSNISSFISEAEAAGLYNIILEPGPGGYLSRLENELGAPPTDSNLYTSGVVCIAEITSESDLPSLISQFSNLQQLMPI